MDDARTIEVEGRSPVWTLLFLEDNRHLLSGSEDGMIRQWSIEYGTQVGEPIKGSERIRALAQSSDHKWIVSGEFRLANVWNRHTWKKVLGVQEHTLEVEAVDVSPESTKFATGARDRKAFIWDISTGRRLIGPLEHEDSVVTVKFSPNGKHLATATWNRECLRIYSARTGQLIRTISARAFGLGTIAWSNDSERIFTSYLNNIKHIYVDTGTCILQWGITGDTVNGHPTGSLTMPSNGRFIACFVGSSLSLMDPSGLRFGPVFEHPGQKLRSIALSLDNHHLAISGESGIITLRNLSGIVPMPHLVHRPRNANGGNPRLQFEALEAFRGALRTLEQRFDELGGPTTQPNNRPRSQVTPLHILDGTYRIKSYISDAYLTCPRDPDGIVVVQQLDPSSDSQRWCVYHAEDGAYGIMGRRGSLDIPLGTGNGNELICVLDDDSTAWTIEPRGHAYVIGNAANAMAIHLTQRPQHVSALLRDNSQNQRWVFEPVENQVTLEIKQASTLCSDVI